MRSFDGKSDKSLYFKTNIVNIIRLDLGKTHSCHFTHRLILPVPRGTTCIRNVSVVREDIYA